ncbi:MAG: hypothetical protein Q4P09_00375 [Phascolarctobacterium sp.]|nr:hypothetical protein [Phascolarctobacterium sp.]
MEQQNSLAHDIKSSADAKYDAACKRLLAYKEFLARIMQRCVVEFKDCSIDDIINKYIEGEPHVAEIGVHPNTSNVKLITGMNSEDKSLNEGWVTYDIIFYALAPQDGYLIKLILNVEAQNDTNPGYPLTKRALYYCGRMLSAQYGREFVNAEYEKLKKVYSIWICTDGPLYKQNTINIYSVKEDSFVGEHVEPVNNYDLLTVVMIYTAVDFMDLQDDVIKMLSVLLSRNLDAQERMNILEDSFGIAMTEKVKQEVDEMCNLSKGIREEGEAIGIVKGEAIGELKERLKNVNALMDSLKVSALDAMEILKFSPEEQQKLLPLL